MHLHCDKRIRIVCLVSVRNIPKHIELVVHTFTVVAVGGQLFYSLHKIFALHQAISRQTAQTLLKAALVTGRSILKPYYFGEIPGAN